MDTQIIGADIGRGYVKGYSYYQQNTYGCCFKSIYSAGRNLDFKDYKRPIYLSIGKNSYFFGELAEAEGYNISTNSMDKKTSQTVELLLYAMLSCIAVSDSVKIMLGVPNRIFNKRTLSEVIEMYKDKIFIFKDNILQEEKRIKVTDISIFRESDSALMYQLRDKGTNDRPCGMVNVGYRTTELCYFDKGLKFIDKKSRSVELGNRNALIEVSKILEQREINKLISEIDSSDEYDEEKQIGYNIISERIAQEIDDFWVNLKEMDIYVAGGTAKRLHLSGENFKLVDDPQMITAKGLYLVGNRMFNRNLKVKQ